MITNQMIADLFVTAYEGGSNHWIDRIEPRFTSHSQYSEASSYHPLMKPYIIFADDDDTPYSVSWNKIQAGLQTMQRDYPRHWADIVDENMDADTADAFLQCVCFGEIIYG